MQTKYHLFLIAGLLIALPIASFASAASGSSSEQAITADHSTRSLDQSTMQELSSQATVLYPVAIDGVPVIQPKQDNPPLGSPEATCDGLWQGPLGGYVGGWFYGDESYAVYQDPDETGCENTYPFTINNVRSFLNAQGEATFEIQALIWEYGGPDSIGTVLCTGPVLSFEIPDAGLYEIFPNFDEPCVVGGPYYAGFACATLLGANVIDVLVDDGAQVPPRSDACYNDYGAGWEDLVDDAGFTWNLLLWSEGETSAGCTDTDSDTLCDEDDPDDDNDGVIDGSDTDPLDPTVCTDADSDGCDDCSIGIDGFGFQADYNSLNDGDDSDSDGICDLSDNCPNVSNPGQEDSDDNGIGDVCEGCCGAYTAGHTGNTDCDVDGKRNLADITRLIDRVYVTKEVLCCPENGNIDGDLDAKINLADITSLIDHVYVTKVETAACN